MTVLTIRAHQRFAVRRAASLAMPAGPGVRRRQVPGLLIELSLHGCRLGQIDAAAFTVGQTVVVTIDGAGDGFAARPAEVRWAQDGCVGLRLCAPLHAAELEKLVRGCRAADTARVAAG